jgi:hypothetical protein
MTSPVTIHGPWELGSNLTATGNRVDASGGGGGTLTGVGTPGYVAIWSSPTNLASSSIYDSGADPRGVILTLGTLSTPDGTMANGVDLTLVSGAAGTAGYGGGDINLRPGAGTGGAYGGSIIGQAGDGSYTAGAGGGGVAFIGGANLGAGKGGAIQLNAGSSTEGDGGDVTIGSGPGSTNTGVGAGGAITITAANGKDGKNNGNITLAVTQGSTSGGFIIITGLPTSNSGVPSGGLWLNSNVLTRVP